MSIAQSVRDDADNGLFNGEKGADGEQGDSGVYVGAGEMPDGYNIQIDPDGNPSEILNGVSVINHTDTMAEIAPNIFNIWNKVTELNITLSAPQNALKYNEYMFQFSSGEVATTLTLPDTIKWVNAPVIEANSTYQCSIVNNIGVLVGVSNE